MTAYQIGSRQGRFTVQAFAEGMLSALGHNPTFGIRKFSGRLEIDPAAPDSAALQVTVEAATLEVADDVSRKDRQEIETRTRDEVLETAKFPQIVFSSTSVGATKLADTQFRLQAKGKLSLHGVEREIEIPVQVKLGEVDARLSGEFRIKQSAYRIQRVSALGGTLRVKDEVKLSFELVAAKESG